MTRWTGCPTDELRFHAWWRRQNPCPAPRQQSDDWQVNLSDEDNYLPPRNGGPRPLLGANLSVHNLCGGWWGEGDDMVMIDGQKWPPDLHGTGSEDWYGPPGAASRTTHSFSTAFPTTNGAHNSLQRADHRLPLPRRRPDCLHQSLRARIEHGHANDRVRRLRQHRLLVPVAPGRAVPTFPAAPNACRARMPPCSRSTCRSPSLTAHAAGLPSILERMLVELQGSVCPTNKVPVFWKADRIISVD